ncbi:DoxX family protein [Patescibacteria group bacterium]|nr:DoxX family protein [Patescibacteria group bacterium]
MQKITLMGGRVLFALPFGVFGIFHLLSAGQLAGLVPALFPGPGVFWVYLTGVIFLLTSASIIFKKYQREGSLLLAVQLLVFIVTVWLPQIGNTETGQLAIVNLLKDTALLGGALTFAKLAREEKK